MAVVAGISAERGLEAFWIQEQSIKTEDFLDFMEALRFESPRRKLALFLDNLSVHRTQAVREAADRLKLKLFFNIPYVPQFNGIEYYWIFVN